VNDDEVLATMKLAVPEVQMDRPVEEIVRRGRARRRNRAAIGVAGGGLAVVATLALILPIAGRQPASAPGNSHPDPGVMVPAGWTLNKAADGKVKLILNAEQFTNPDALRKALDGAGIPSAVKAGAYCKPVGAELPQANDVYHVQVAPPDIFTFSITPQQMPANSRLYFSVFHPRAGKGAKSAVSLVSNKAAMTCVPESEMQK